MPMFKNNDIKYFLPGPSQESDRKTNTEITKQIPQDFEDHFNGIGCFDGTFSLQLEPDNKPYQAPTRHIPHELQKLFKDELERLQQQDIIALLGIDEIEEWCNSFVLIPKPNAKVRVCLGPAGLNQVLIRPVLRGPTLIYIFPKINNIKYCCYRCKFWVSQP